MLSIGSKFIKAFLYFLLITLSILCLLPFVMMLVNATRSGIEIMSGFTLIPSTHLMENWKTVTQNIAIFRGMANSALIATCVTVLSGYFSSVTAYAFAMFNFKGRNAIFSFILLFMMVPAQLSLFGFYDLVNSMHLVNSYIPLIIPSIATINSVFFLRQYTASVLPRAILEAPRIDGAGELLIFHRIALPIMMPGLATISIGTFIGTWNSYLMPLILLNDPKKLTLPLLIASLKSVQNVIKNQGATYLAVAISVIPILIVFAFFSRHIISSIAAGSVKE